MTHNTAKLSDISCKTQWTFSYKGRRWWCGPLLPWLGEYEIHTVTGNRYTTLPDIEVKGLKFEIPKKTKAVK